jgi:hypothetical protein
MIEPASSDGYGRDILIVGLATAVGLYIAIWLTLRYYFRQDT